MMAVEKMVHPIETDKITVLILDDHVAFRRGVYFMFKEHINLLEAQNITNAISLINTHTLDLVLLDLGLPDIDGFSCLEILKLKFPNLRVAIMSGSTDKKDMEFLIRKGAAGFIPKTHTPEAMLEAIKTIVEGKVYVPCNFSQNRSLNLSDDVQHNIKDSRTFLTHLGLTKRQIEVFLLLETGRKNKEIGTILDIGEDQVKNHVTVILKKLGVSTRTQAVLYVKRKVGTDDE